MLDDYTPYQQKVIKRYYANQDTVHRQRLAELVTELYLAAGMNKEALAEFEASNQVVPNRFRTIAGAAAAARGTGSADAAKRYYRALTVLAVGGDGDRAEISEARMYLAKD